MTMTNKNDLYKRTEIDSAYNYTIFNCFKQYKICGIFHGLERDKQSLAIGYLSSYMKSVNESNQKPKQFPSSSSQPNPRLANSAEKRFKDCCTCKPNPT